MMAAEAKQADVERAAASSGLLDVLHIVAAHNADEGNAAVGICHGAWSDTRVWMAIIDMQHSPKKASGKVYCTAPRLYIASRRGKLDVVQRLLDLGADIDAKSANGSTALFAASRRGHVHVANFLLDRHADIDALNNYNDSALYLACLFANVEATRVLLARGANVDLGKPPILTACRLPHQNEQAKMDMSTLWARRLQVVRLLADHNASLNVIDAKGRTAIMEASRSNQPAIIELLCDRHVDVNVLKNDNKSALYLACYWANVEATRVLFVRGANVDLGKPPILAACMLPHEDEQAKMDMSTLWARRLQVVRLLADHNANLNVIDARGRTAIMEAGRNNQAAIIELLCDRHADINMLNNNNKSALNIACYFANTDATRVLLVRGSNVDLGDPPILTACRLPGVNDRAKMDMSTLWARRCKIVIELVRHNADLDVVTAQGHGPLDLAERNNQQDIVVVLREALGMSDDEEEEEEEEEEEDGWNFFWH